jgi:drug/metabolite transporter (DMT)-like permease
LNYWRRVAVSVLLALVGALAYGISDFVGGLASRRQPALRVLLLSYPVGVLLMAALLPVVPGHLDAATLAWSAAAGVAGATGVVLLYVGLAVGPMGVVAPLTAVASAVVPVAVGIALGERPPLLAYAGVGLALLGVVLVSRGPTEDPAHARVTVRVVGIALLAGVGFGLYFVLLAQAPTGSGGWPLLVSRLASALVVTALAVGTGRAGRLTGGVGRLAVAAGALDALANLAYLLAVRQGLLSLVAVVVALYPAATILLARLVLGERTGPAQRVGLAVAAGSVALIAWAG